MNKKQQLEYFAGLAMQALITTPNSALTEKHILDYIKAPPPYKQEYYVEYVTKRSVEYAKAMISEINSATI